jgi:hypothetical protein
MPVPVEFDSIRRMSTVTIPKQDIDFGYGAVSIGRE